MDSFIEEISKVREGNKVTLGQKKKMKKYSIHEIYAEGYERIAIIEGIEKGVRWNAHFIEYDEFLELGEH